MYMPTVMAFLHHLAAFAVVAALCAQLALFTPPLGVAQARRILRIDLLYGLSAMAVLVIGLLRVFLYERGGDYYFANGFFLLKLALFLAVGLLSIYPTVLFRSWSKGLRQGDAPALTDAQCNRVRQLLKLELIGVAGILLCAAAMADGMGYMTGG